MSSPASTEENIGLFMLRKDSERRATLHRVLTDYISLVVFNIQDSVPQVREQVQALWNKVILLLCRTGTVQINLVLYRKNKRRRQMFEDKFQSSSLLWFLHSGQNKKKNKQNDSFSPQFISSSFLLITGQLSYFTDAVLAKIF